MVPPGVRIVRENLLDDALAEHVKPERRPGQEKRRVFSQPVLEVAGHHRVPVENKNSFSTAKFACGRQRTPPWSVAYLMGNEIRPVF
jgi:hypothetical protein